MFAAQTARMTKMNAGEISDRIAQTLKDRLEQSGEHLQVKDVNGEHVGTVDHLQDGKLKLTKTDSTDGQHHFIELSQVESMDEVAVYLNVPHSAIA
jgi:hypothetical protein